MKTLFIYLLSIAALLGQSTGDYSFTKKTAGGYEQKWITPETGKAITWNSSGNPVNSVISASWSTLSDKATADLPVDNSPLAAALAGKVNLAGGNTISGTQTFSGSILGADISAATVSASGSFSGPGTGITGTASGLTAGAVSAIDGQTATVTRIPVTYTNTTDFTTTSTSFVNVTGLSFPVLANNKYQIIFGLLSNKTDISGLQIQFTGPASPLKFFNRFFGSTTSMSVNASPDIHTAFSVSSTTFNTVNGDGYIQSENMAILSNGANAGTVQIQLKCITGGTAKIYAGSWIQVTQLD